MKTDFPVGAEVTAAELANRPYDALRRLRSAEPVSWIPALGAWLITGRDLAIQAMRDAETFTVSDPRFSTAAVLGQSMLSVDGPEHERYRRPFAPSFRPGIVRDRFGDFLAEEAAALVAGFVNRGHAELRTELAGPLAVNTITEFLGLVDVTATDVLGWYRSISDAITNFNFGQTPDAAEHAAVTALNQRAMAIIEQAGRGQADDSLVGRIVAEGTLEPEEIGSSVAVIMFGAVETAEGMTANALWHLLTNPDALARVSADRSLVDQAIEESLRLEPAAATIDRYTTVDATIGGVTIPAGELVTISLLGANRDPALFDRPDRFDLDRHNAKHHVTFVQGPHGCIGRHLARMETAAAIGAVLDAVPGLSIDRERSTPPRGLIFRKPERLVARWGQPSVTTM